MGLFEQFKVAVAGKAVLGHNVGFVILVHLVVPQGTHNGEEYRGVAFPVFRVGLPQEFSAVAFADDAAQLSTLRLGFHNQAVIFKNFHIVLLNYWVCNDDTTISHKISNNSYNSKYN